MPLRKRLRGPQSQLRVRIPERRVSHREWNAPFISARKLDLCSPDSFRLLAKRCRFSWSKTSAKLANERRRCSERHLATLSVDKSEEQLADLHSSEKTASKMDVSRSPGLSDQLGQTVLTNEHTKETSNTLSQVLSMQCEQQRILANIVRQQRQQLQVLTSLRGRGPTQQTLHPLLANSANLAYANNGAEGNNASYVNKVSGLSNVFSQQLGDTRRSLDKCLKSSEKSTFEKFFSNNEPNSRFHNNEFTFSQSSSQSNLSRSSINTSRVSLSLNKSHLVTNNNNNNNHSLFMTDLNSKMAETSKVHVEMERDVAIVKNDDGEEARLVRWLREQQCDDNVVRKFLEEDLSLENVLQDFGRDDLRRLRLKTGPELRIWHAIQTHRAEQSQRRTMG